MVNSRYTKSNSIIKRTISILRSCKDSTRQIADFRAGNVIFEQQADEAIDLYLADNSQDIKNTEESVIKYQL